jgi:hypothetical protein
VLGDREEERFADLHLSRCTLTTSFTAATISDGVYPSDNSLSVLSSVEMARACRSLRRCRSTS